MNPTELLSALHTAERLKDTTRHCCTSRRRPESVAGHSWRIALMAYWMRDEFPEADMDKVIRMCLIHDLGECFTGDIPTFRKTAADEADEERQLLAWVDTLPAPYDAQMRALYREWRRWRPRRPAFTRLWTSLRPSSSTTSPPSTPGSPGSTT